MSVYLFVKLLAALLSAVTLSLMFTLNERPSPFDPYSFGFVFLNGSFVLFQFFVLGGIPLSMAADRVASKSGRRSAAQLVLYFLSGVGLWFLFALWRQLATPAGAGWSASLWMPLVFGIAGAVFFVFQSLLVLIVRSLKK
ncbi:MAG: hypothetical protein BAA02_09640 [Paenibacillaceae bacterium ZCTH02-B3]|nr:MAG: hypothetical protein BAA02_09640 [Paenibacillaceae bacterium ZCTH02-B3]